MSWRPATTGSTSRATTPGTCGGTRWSRSGTPAARSTRHLAEPRGGRRRAAARARRAGRSSGSRGGAVTTSQRLARRALARLDPRFGFVPFAILQAALAARTPAATRPGPGRRRRLRDRRGRLPLLLPASRSASAASTAPAGRARVRLRRSSRRTSSSLTSSARPRSRQLHDPGADRGGGPIRHPRRPRPRRGERSGAGAGRSAARPDHFNDSSTTTNVTAPARDRGDRRAGRRLARPAACGAEAALADARASRPRQLRDELGRRADLLEAANRCARALGSSLELDEAFGAFIRELRKPDPVRPDGDHPHRGGARAGDGDRRATGATRCSGRARLSPGALIEEVLRTGETVYRRDMSDHRYPEEVTLSGIGLRSRVAAPLLLGARPIGMVAILAQATPDAFSPTRSSSATLLGRLVASAVQNIRAYEPERETVEELRRLSALRADFVSLVSHELRSPMAAVIGAARTLQERWRELTPDQRKSFLALIGDETSRLANLIGDVLDTSRIEAGTFTLPFGGRGPRRARPRHGGAGDRSARTRSPSSRTHAAALPTVRGDRERLRQVLDEPRRQRGQVLTGGRGGRRCGRGPTTAGCCVSVEDSGPGIPREHQGVIFEKFGRANVGRGEAGHRPRPLHRAFDHRGARRHAGVRSAPGSGRDLHA